MKPGLTPGNIDIQILFFHQGPPNFLLLLKNKVTLLRGYSVNLSIMGVRVIAKGKIIIYLQ